MLLYTEQDYAAAKRKTGRRLAGFIMLLLAAVGLTALFVTVWRNRWAADAVAIVGACLCYAFLTIKLLPWIRYWQYLKDIQAGKTHTTEAWFVSCSDGTRRVDGVAFHEMIVRLGDGGEEDERMFFWDGDKELPPLQEGQKITLISFGNYITELLIEE